MFLLVTNSFRITSFQMDQHSGMTGLDMLGSPHSDGMSSGHSMSSSLPISSANIVDPHSHQSAQLAVNAAVHHSAMYGHGHSAAASMMSPHTSLVHPHHPHHHHTPVVSMQDTDTDPRYKPGLTKKKDYIKNEIYRRHFLMRVTMF